MADNRTHFVLIETTDHASFFRLYVDLNPVLVGLSLLYTNRLTGMFQFCVRQTAEVENQVL